MTRSHLAIPAVLPCWRMALAAPGGRTGALELSPSRCPLLALALWDFFQQRHCAAAQLPADRPGPLGVGGFAALPAHLYRRKRPRRPALQPRRSARWSMPAPRASSTPIRSAPNSTSIPTNMNGSPIRSRPTPTAPEEWRVHGRRRPMQPSPTHAALLNISAMSFGSLSAQRDRGAQQGRGRWAVSTTTPAKAGCRRYHRKHGGDLVWEIGSGYFGCRDRRRAVRSANASRDTPQLEQVKMVEIKLSQGAKPGHGGVLPGAKVTAEIAEARGVPAGEDCISPAAHSTFSTPARAARMGRATARALRRQAGRDQAVRRQAARALRGDEGDAGNRHPARFHRRRRRRGRHRRRAAANCPTASACRCAKA